MRNNLKAYMSRHVLFIAFVIGGIAIVGGFGLSYSFFGHDGLPIGWDTPHYIGQMGTVLSEGFIAFVWNNEFYNFVYAGISSVFVWAGVSPVTVEVFFPIFLSVSLMGVSGYFAKKYLGNTEVAVYTTLLAALWFGLYRIGTDLHPNLLALVLLVAALSLFPPWNVNNKSSRFRRFVFFALIFLISFVHIETTLLFSFVILVVSIIHEWKVRSEHLVVSISRDVFPLFLASLPGSILYYFHMTNLVNYSRGNPVFQPPLSAQLWLIYLGFLLPFSVYGLYSMLKATPKDDAGGTRPLAFLYIAFISTWGLTSIVVACVDYVIPAFSIFSERALMLFPSPFIAAFGLKTMLGRARKGWRFRFSIHSQSIMAFAILAVVLVSGWTGTYASMIPHQRVWISSSEYQKLVWLSNNRLVGKPIFIYYDYDEYAGGMATLWDNWVQAIYGDHYSYVGRLDFLLAKQETPFKSVVSKTVSLTFLDKIVKDGIFIGDTILNYDIVIMKDFYRLGDLKSEYEDILDQINEGIFVVNTQKATNRQTNRLSLYSGIYEKLGNWYGIETNWTVSSYALEFWDPNASSSKYFEILIPSASQGRFSLSLRYRDGTVGDLLIELNGTSLGRIHYEQTGEPRIFTTSVMMSPGIYSLRISLEYNPGIPQYASLDFVEITKESSH